MNVDLADSAAIPIQKIESTMSQRYYSNVYWHFTGSPQGVDWFLASSPKDILDQGAVLDSERAAQIAIEILESRKLLATCTEKIIEGVVTPPFCCVTDIPFKDLPSHSPYYERVAIGFKPKPVQRQFVPVLYFPKQVLPMIFESIPNRRLEEMGRDFLVGSGGWSEAQGMRFLAQAALNPENVEVADKRQISGFYSSFVKITDFEPEPENTYYREREWRGIGDFEFQYEDVEAVVAPGDHLQKIREALRGLGAESKNLISWEFVEAA